MTALKQEAFTMIDQLSDEKLKYVIKFIRNIDSFIKPENKIPDKMQAFQNLEKLRLHLPDDFDYEKELEESREFKYGSIN